MHNYGPFEVKSYDDKAAFVAARRFANLVVTGPKGPEAAHVPMILRKDAEGRLVLEGHVARSNPLAQLADAGVRALAIFNGVDAYVTPSLYPSKKVHGKVAPTWNYVAVQVTGELHTFEDAAQLRDQLEALTDTMEAGLAAPWTVADAPPEFTAKLLNAITGVRMVVETMEGIRKLSQNQRQPERDGVLAGLSQSDDPVARLVAEEMSKEA
ncbi:MAG: FMN-binding negative transcriptional regulator [Hyphomonadaceae bacterium]